MQEVAGSSSSSLLCEQVEQDHFGILYMGWDQIQSFDMQALRT